MRETRPTGWWKTKQKSSVLKSLKLSWPKKETKKLLFKKIFLRHLDFPCLESLSVGIGAASKESGEGTRERFSLINFSPFPARPSYKRRKSGKSGRVNLFSRKKNPRGWLFPSMMWIPATKSGFPNSLSPSATTADCPHNNSKTLSLSHTHTQGLSLLLSIYQVNSLGVAITLCRTLINFATHTHTPPPPEKLITIYDFPFTGHHHQHFGHHQHGYYPGVGGSSPNLAPMPEVVTGHSDQQPPPRRHPISRARIVDRNNNSGNNNKVTTSSSSASSAASTTSTVPTSAQQQQKQQQQQQHHNVVLKVAPPQASHPQQQQQQQPKGINRISRKISI